VNEVMDIVGETPITDLGERAGDVPASYAWSKKLADATGWRAQVPLRDGLERTVEWFQQHLGSIK
jgi:nucleoside-diphosphate-sugar epimerase